MEKRVFVALVVCVSLDDVRVVVPAVDFGIHRTCDGRGETAKRKLDGVPSDRHARYVAPHAWVFPRIVNTLRGDKMPMGEGFPMCQGVV
jgi:hypothetical protein